MKTPRIPCTATALAITGPAAVAAVAVCGLRASQTEEIAEAALDPAQITDVPVIVGKQQSGGLHLLGIRSMPPTCGSASPTRAGRLAQLNPPPPGTRPERNEAS